jgi:formamidopyrimidine-DNA glycosylase
LPKLPDVEILRQYVESTSLHKTIIGVEVESERILEGVSPPELTAAVKGKQFQSARRHGKHLLVELEPGPWLDFHFGMTGDLKYFKDMEKDPEHDRLLFSFDNGFHLAYVSQRKLGKVRLSEDVESFVKERQLGPDVLTLDLAGLKNAVRGKRGAIKTFLMNQGYIAGIGNVYADEILFHCGLHPETPVSRLGEDKLKELFQTLGKVLRRAIDFRADPERFPDSSLLPHRHKGGKCPHGHGELQKTSLSGRASYYCPVCQEKTT